MIKVEALEFKYEDGTKVLDNINIDLNKGKIVGIVGANGCGKSTLFLNIMGILKPNKGCIKYNEVEISYNKKYLREYRKMVNIVFQDPEKQLFYSNVYDDVAFSLRNLKICEDEVKARVDRALKKSGAYKFKDKPIHFLSYGQKKRVAIAGTLALDSKVILLDEPTSGLDPYMTKEIKNIVKEISTEKNIVISSHDMDLIYDVCDYVYILGKGQILGEGYTEEVFLREELLKMALLEKPWLVKLHQLLGVPLFKNEEQLVSYGIKKNK